MVDSAIRAHLLAELRRRWRVLAWKCEGLDDEQLHREATPSGLSLVGLLESLATEASWIIGEYSRTPPADRPIDPVGAFNWCLDRLGDVDAQAGDQPGFADALGRLLLAAARAVGRADVIRERIDGQTGDYPPEAPEPVPTPLAPHPRVLFVCLSNAGKSRMAEALLRLKVGPRASVASAGVRPSAMINDFAARVVGEIGAQMTGDRPHLIEARQVRDADYVILLGSDVDVDVTGDTIVERWVIDEPSERGIEGVERMRLVRDDIEAHVNALIDRLELED